MHGMQILIHASRNYDAQACYCVENSRLGAVGGEIQPDIRILAPLSVYGESFLHLDIPTFRLISFV
jgi:hypothetical protein